MLFYETARNNPERRRAAAAVARHLRFFLEDYHGLGRRRA